ncbi:hypothetical protein K435DRAFT_707560, partial [Dendrothele bispora CBS 962.96]
METALGGEESAVDDFATFLLRTLNYEQDGDRVIRTRTELSMTMCGATVYAKPDISVVDRNTNSLLQVQEDKVSLLRTSNRQNPEPQLVAEMLAAFYNINLTRGMQGKDLLNSKLIPGITMRGVV